MILPEEFQRKMKKMLGWEYEAFLKSYEKPFYRGIRWNSLKCNFDDLLKTLPFTVTPTKFSSDSFYAPPYAKFGNLPAHHAGMFYAQEPSAAAAVTVLSPKPGDKVLDLCAAPGGKSTQIAALLNGEGLLWANEIVRERANILLSNIERMGIRNSVISSLHPDHISGALCGFFDKVLVDAPCSGEGMFKKEPQASATWSEESIRACAKRQRTILDSAAKAVRPGGILVYSTCTFSKEENEDNVLSFLHTQPEFELLPIKVPFGRDAFDLQALRIFPMDGGEGHFVAKFRKIGQDFPDARRPFVQKGRTTDEAAAETLYAELFHDACPKRMYERNHKLYILPGLLPDLAGLPVLRAGVLFGEVKGSRIEPAHGIFMSKSMRDCRRRIDFNIEDSALYDFLHGEEIDCSEKGYTAVGISGVVTGFGKASGGRLKNRYPKGLRLQK